MAMQNLNDGGGMSDDPSIDDMPLDLAIDDDPDLRLRMGRYLGGIRKLRKISQEQVAKDINMSRPHLSNVEQGRSRTGWKGLRDMASYYGYGIAQLIEEVQREKPAGSVTRIPRLAPSAAAGTAFERNMSQVLLNDVRFVTDIFLALDAQARAKVVDLLKQLVDQRFDKVGGNE